MKTTINGFLHCKPADAYAQDAVNGYELTFFHCENMVECGYTFVKPISIDIDLPNDWNPALEIIATLQAKKASVMAEFQARVTEIEAAINKLTAIEYVEAA